MVRPPVPYLGADPAVAGQASFPEIDCVRHCLPPRLVDETEQRASAIGVGADRVLICRGAMTERDYLTALADRLGSRYEPLNDVLRVDCPLDDDGLIAAAATGVLPLRRRRSGLGGLSAGSDCAPSRQSA